MSNLKNLVSYSQKIFTALLLMSSSNYLEAAWTTPVQISSSNSDQVDIAVDLSGNASAIWQGYDGSNYVIQSASLPFSGSWSTPATLSASGQDSQGPQIAVNNFGNVVAIWSRFDGTESIIQAASQVFGSVWLSPVNISSVGGNADSPNLSMDYSGLIGNAVAVWHRYNGSNFIIQSAELLLGALWSLPVDVSPSGQDALIPSVAVDLNGNSVAVCSRYNGSNFTSRSCIDLFGDNWGSSYLLSAPADASTTTDVAVDQAGNAVVVWSQFNGSNYAVQSANVPYGGSWGTAVTLSVSGQNAFIPKVDSDPAGNAIAAWVGFDGTNYIVQSATLTTGGGWSAPINLSTDGVNVTNLDVIVNRSGYAVVIWDETDGVHSSVYSATHIFSESLWQSPILASASGAYAYLPSIDIDDAGNAVAIWLQTSGANNYVFAATLPSGS